MNPYRNYHVMQKRRRELMIPGSKCRRCNRPAVYVHHKDFTKYNHAVENLELICRSCHAKIHYTVRNTTIFIKGKQIKYWAKKLGVSYTTIKRRYLEGNIFKGRSKTKIEKLYGSTLTQLSEKLGITRARVHQLHKLKLLKKRLREEVK